MDRLDNSESVLVEKRDRVALITLNRPEKLNPFDLEVHRRLEDLFEELGSDAEVGAAVLTGAGRAFSAGGDIRMMKDSLQRGHVEIPMANAYRLINNILSFEKPLIAAVNGHAVGLGATIALFCDVIFMSEKAKIGDPHVNVGLVAGDGGAVIWPLLVGASRAKQYLMTGDLIDAREAERIGLVNNVLPSEEVLPAALAFATRLANGPSKAINWTKSSINQHLRNAMNLVLPTSLATEYLSMTTRDHEEAIDAFLEKRPARFTGK